MEFYFGIPTYNRVKEQLTLAFLKNIGVCREQIILATQDEGEYEECKSLYNNDCLVIYRKAYNLSGNRNTIIDFLPTNTNVLILDDDISGFEIKRGTRLEKLSGNAFFEIAERMFILTRKYGGKLWSVYPVRNAYFMESEPIVKFNKSIICVHGVITSELRYNEEQTVKEDFLFVCDNFAKGFPTLRLDNVVAIAKHWTNEGGCKNQWGTNSDCMKKLLNKYPQYIRANPKREGEVLIRQNVNVGGKRYGKEKVRLF